MPPVLAFVIEHDKRPGFGRKSSRVAKALFAIIGAYWHKHFLPKHFESGAAQRYGYQPRTEKHIQKRARRWKVSESRAAQYDLALSGAMCRDITRRYSIRAYPSRFSVIMSSPESYVRMRPVSTSKMPNLGEEATRVIPAEEKKLAAVADRALPGLIAAEGGKVRTRIKA